MNNQAKIYKTNHASMAIKNPILIPHSSLLLQYNFAPNLSPNLQDLSQHNNHGQITGASFVTKNGKNLLYFDGTNDYLLTPDHSSLNPNSEITLIFVFKPIENQMNICNKANNEGGSSRSGYLCEYIATSKIKISFGKSTGWDSLTSNNTIPLSFTHIAITRKTTSCKIFINGNLDTSTNAFSTTYQTNSQDITYQKNGWSSSYTEAYIKHIEIHNKALSTNSIFKHYQKFNI